MQSSRSVRPDRSRNRWTGEHTGDCLCDHPHPESPANTDEGRPGPWSRRRALALGGAALASVATTGVGVKVGPAAAGSTVRSVPPARLAVAPVASAATDPIEALKPTIRPRTDWAVDRPPTGELLPEEDVRFLLVHHTASRNDYGPDEVAGEIQGFYDFHTGPEKNWPDVAYNFFVDRFGDIWEARAGSIDGPVRGDATGGSQGFAILCSLIGNHAEGPVSPEAQASLVSLLAWLGQRYEVDTTPGATTEFVSRGSNLHPAGATVVARTVSGHREMSSTSCPGDFTFDLLSETIPGGVTQLRLSVTAPPTAPPTTASTAAPTTVPPTPEPQQAGTTDPAPSISNGDQTTGASEPGGSGLPGAVTAGVAAGVAAVAAVAVRLGARLQR